MRNIFNKLLPKKFLGIDIGTSSIKIVEVSKFGNKKKLENYGQIFNYDFSEKSFKEQEKNLLLLSSEEIVKAIKEIIQETKIKTKHAVFSIPDFSSFFTTFTLPPMTKDELAESVKYEAKQHIPVPLTEVALDWEIIDSKILSKDQIVFKILLVAVPNEIINQYQEIAKKAGLELVALEAEVFSLMRALTNKQDKKLISVVDIGTQSTTCSIIEKQVLQTSHSFDVSDNNFISIISEALNIDLKQAEQLKKKNGINLKDNKIKEIIMPLIDIMIREIKEIFDNFYRQEKREVEKIILSGGPALTPGLKEYFQDLFIKQQVEISNPFVNMVYPKNLEKILIEIGPSFAIAVGAALRRL